MGKSRKSSKLHDPPSISECNDVRDKPTGIWGVFDEVFDPPKWFGHIMHVGCGIDQEVVLVSKRCKKRLF